MILTREQRFWKKVQKTEGCWLWTASKMQKGYGYFWFENRVQPAHRVSYRLAKGAIPDGQMVLHSCDNPSCVNPDHLSLGTAQDNSTDMIRRGRSATGLRNGNHTQPESKLRGEQCSWSKLTEADVKEIRAAGHTWSAIEALAKKYEVTAGSIYDIVRRKNWRHVA